MPNRYTTRRICMPSSWRFDPVCGELLILGEVSNSPHTGELLPQLEPWFDSRLGRCLSGMIRFLFRRRFPSRHRAIRYRSPILVSPLVLYNLRHTLRPGDGGSIGDSLPYHSTRRHRHDAAGRYFAVRSSVKSSIWEAGRLVRRIRNLEDCVAERSGLEPPVP